MQYIILENLLNMTNLTMLGVGSVSAGAAASTNTHTLDLEAGSSQEATAADSASLDITGSFTIEAWIKLESNPATNDWYIIAGKGKSASSFPTYSLGLVNDAGTIYMRGVYTNTAGSAKGVATGGTAPTIGTWQHWAVTYNSAGGADSGKMYLNGVENVSATQDADTLESNAVEFSIGSDPSAKFFDGIIDDVRVWNVVRTATQISDNYQTELVGNESGLVAYWKLNNANTDATANANDLTVNTGTFVTDKPF